MVRVTVSYRKTCLSWIDKYCQGSVQILKDFIWCLMFDVCVQTKFAPFDGIFEMWNYRFCSDFFTSNVFIRVLRNNYLTFYNIWPFWGQIREGGVKLTPPPFIQKLFDRASRTRCVRLTRVGRNGFFLPKIFVLNIWALKSQKKTRPFPNFCPGQLFRGGCQIDPPPHF